MQYEGYDNKKKHLFTFIVPDSGQETGTKNTRGESLLDSEFSEDDESKMDRTVDMSQVDGVERITEYDATEKLLVLQQNLGNKIREGSITQMNFGA